MELLFPVPLVELVELPPPVLLVELVLLPPAEELLPPSEELVPLVLLSVLLYLGSKVRYRAALGLLNLSKTI